MSDTTTLISALENAPGIIIPLIREVPPQYLKRRPSPTKWSVHEHACHLSNSVGPFLARLDLMLSAPAPLIRSIINSPEDESGALLNVDLDERLDQYVRERAGLVNRLKELSVEDWQRTAEHEAFRHYSVWIMFRHLLTHEMSHAYRIEELLLKKDWE
jgi:DinB superfamily